MNGFKAFLMRGNLIELAVAVIVGAVFTNMVTTFTNMLMDIIGRIGQVPDFSRTSVFGIGIGAFLSAVLAFLLTSSIVYFFIVLPYTWLARLWKPREPQKPVVRVTTEDILAEIRDILRDQQLAGGPSAPRDPAVPGTVSRDPAIRLVMAAPDGPAPSGAEDARPPSVSVARS